MKQRNMLIVAIASGVLCAVCIGAYLMSVQGRVNAERAETLARYGGEQVEVCVASRDIAAGERVDASSVETKLWVADLLPEGAVRQSADVAGRVATSSILKGEVVCEKRFEADREALDVPAGKEAVSVPARAVQAVGGAIKPGMSVDVYAAGDTATTLIVQDVIVLATSVGGSGSLLSSDAGWITLAIDSERVQEVIAAANKTSLYFVVPGSGRELDDVEDAGATEVSTAASAGKSSEASAPSSVHGQGDSMRAGDSGDAKDDGEESVERSRGGE